MQVHRMHMKTQTNEAAEQQGGATTFGQLISVDWDKLGEVTEYLWDGFYRVYVEGDYPGKSIYATVHQNRLEAVTA